MKNGIVSWLCVLLCLCGAKSLYANPVTDTLFVDGREWAQPDLFYGLRWSQIDAVCSGGPCADGALLTHRFDPGLGPDGLGYDMTGWNWAGTREVNSLLEYYIGADVLPDHWFYQYLEDEPSWLDDLYEDGWRHTGIYPNDRGATMSIEGWTHNFAVVKGDGVRTHLYDRNWGAPSLTLTGSTISPEFHTRQLGGWFYRTVEVPAPTSLLLLLAGLFFLPRYTGQSKQSP